MTNKNNESKESKISFITDMIVWLMFIVTLVCSIALLVTGTWVMLMNPSFTAFMYYLGASAAFGLHYAIKNV